MPPTLKVRGKLKATGYGPDQAELDVLIPIDYIVNFIKRCYKRSGPSPLNRLFLVLATPGSGKTTTMVGDLFYALHRITGRGLACTQPRVNTCIEKAREMVGFYNEETLKEQQMLGDPLELGYNIGYNTANDKLIPTQVGITYMTSGVLNRQITSNGDEFIRNRYGVIVVDEAHDKSTPTVELIDNVKKFIWRNYALKSCPIFILTTGTFDPFIYADYLLDEISLPERYFNIISVEGSSHPIDHRFLSYNSTDLIATVKKLLYTIHIDFTQDYVNEQTSNTPKFKQLIEEGKKAREKIVDGGYDRKTYANILVFDSGALQRSFEGALSNLKDPLMKEYPIKPFVISRNNVNAKDKIYEEAINFDVEDLKHNGKKAARKVIVSTNVVETGATIARLGYCIDTGWCKKQNFNPNFNAHMLLTQPVTKDMHTQRIGRVGRTAPGTAYATFSKDTYDKLLDYTIPEIAVSDCSSSVLAMIVRECDYEFRFPTTKVSGYATMPLVYTNVMEMDSIDSPPLDMMQYQIEKLFTLGLIEPNNENHFKPTAFGLLAQRFIGQINEMTVECFRILYAGLSMGLCMYDLVLIVSVASLASFECKKVSDVIPEILMPSPTKDKIMDSIKDTVICSALVLRYIINLDADLVDTCDKMGCELDNVTDILKKREEIIFSLKECGMDPFANYKELTDYKTLHEFANTMKAAIVEGLKMNTMTKSGEVYLDDRTKLPIKLSHDFGGKAYYYALVFKQSRKGIHYQVSNIDVGSMDFLESPQSL